MYHLDKNTTRSPVAGDTSTLSLIVLASVALASTALQPHVASAQVPNLRPPSPIPGARAKAKLRAAAQAKEKAAKADKKTPPGLPRPGPAAPPRGPGAPLAPEPEDDATSETTLKPFETGIDYKPTPPGKRVTFNLENADLQDLVRLISQLTGRRFILPAKMRNVSATVYAPTKVTAAEAYQAFLSVLEMNGLSLVPAGRYLKIVESGGVQNRPIPLQSDGEDIPRGDRFLTRLHWLKHTSTDDAIAVLERFKSPDGSVTAYAPSSMLIITDTGTNLRRMMRVLEVIDVPRTSEHIWVEPVHHAAATDMAKTLSEIFESGTSGTSSRKTKAKARPAKGKAPKSSGTSTIGSSRSTASLTKILADERTNSLIILASERAYLRILQMLRRLDVTTEGEGRIHVHHLQHSDAKDLAGTLSKLVGRGGKAAKGAKGSKDVAAVFEGDIAITAHESSNALVITSSPHDYASLRRTIDKLDVQKKQVFIEAVIMELSVNRSSNLGLSFHGGLEGFPVDDSFTVMGSDAITTVAGVEGLATADGLTGLAVGVQGPELEGVNIMGRSPPAFGVALQAKAESGDADILATPHLIAMDNTEAEISVGGNVPVQGSVSGFGNLAGLGSLAGGQGAQALQGLSALSGLGYGGTVPRQDVGTTIKITPHINESDQIRLEISEEISELGAAIEGTASARAVNRTRAKTQVAVRDQQTVVIGGLMRDTVTTNESKVPILGDLPLIGMLFRSTGKQKQKKNLLLFLTPYIIRSAADLRSIYERKMRERQEFIDRYFVFGGREYDPPVDYSRTRGLVAEMLVELQDLDEQRRLLQDAESKPPPEHVRTTPISDAEVIGDEEGEGGDDGGDEGGEPPESPEPPEPSGDEPEAAPPPTPPPMPTPPMPPGPGMPPGPPGGPEEEEE